jgi:hypothetical protein
MGYLGLGFLAGFVWLFTRAGGMSSHGPSWVYKWFHPRNVYGDRRNLRRLERALKRNRLDFRWDVFGALPKLIGLGVLLCLPGMDESFMNFAIGMLGGYVGSGFLVLRLGMLPHYHAKVIGYAAREAARRLHPSVANAWILPLAARPEPGVRLAIVDALRILGTPEAIQTLEQLASTNGDAPLALAARSAANDLKALNARAHAPGSVESMASYAITYQYLLPKMGKSRYTKEHNENVARFEELMQKMDAISFSHLAVRRSFPHVFCKQCLTRGELHGFEAWEWVTCRRCNLPEHLVPGVVTAIGCIGAAVDWEVKDGALRVALWNEATRKARAGEVTVLEIAGGHEVQYDWAVSAVVSALEGQGYTDGGKVKVRLVNSPPLEPNSRLLLETLKG